MNKQEFLDELQKKLSELPTADIEERLAFYGEMIDDSIEEGFSEAEAVNAIGSAEEISKQILADAQITKSNNVQSKPDTPTKVWTIVLLVLGSPIWISLLAAALAVLIAALAVIWFTIISLFAAEASLVACSFAGVFSSFFLAIQGNALSGVAMLGAGICCSGLSIFLGLGCKEATKGVLLLTKKIAACIKSLFVGKVGVK